MINNAIAFLHQRLERIRDEMSWVATGFNRVSGYEEAIKDLEAFAKAAAPADPPAPKSAKSSQACPKCGTVMLMVEDYFVNGASRKLWECKQCRHEMPREAPPRDADCTGRGQCHGSLAWCNVCGEVGDVCSAVDCDTHHRKAGRNVELQRVLAELNTPETMDFIKGIQLEAVHQRERWGPDHDVNKTDADWFWLIGYLVGKALHIPEKRTHHLITAGAALANWHTRTARKAGGQ